jgi:AcrR family transcriptional regulator
MQLGGKITLEKAEKARILGQKYPHAALREDSPTKERILLTAARLFATNSYNGVSVKDIADEVGIKPASLYNHFESKEALWEAILNRIRSLYMMYFSRLAEAAKPDDSFETVLGNMFVELKNVVDLFIYYGIGSVQAEQFHSESARALLHSVFWDYSVEFIKGMFDDCVANRRCPPFNTRIMAMVIMSNVLTCNNLRVHESLGNAVPFDVTAYFYSLERFILDSVRVGADAPAAVERRARAPLLMQPAPPAQEANRLAVGLAGA